MQAQPHVSVKFSANTDEHKGLETHGFDLPKKWNKDRGRQASETRALGDCADTRCVAHTARGTETSTVPELPVVQSRVTQALLLSWVHGTPLRGTRRSKQSRWKGY